MSCKDTLKGNQNGEVEMVFCRSLSSLRLRSGSLFYGFMKEVGYLTFSLLGYSLGIVEALLQAEGLKEFVKSSRVRNKAFIAQL